jgi:hypothetical protein
MRPIPDWLQHAFAEWLTHRLYVDGRGNYRARVEGRPIVRYNRALKRLYPSNEAFHRAAHLWRTLWEMVPDASVPPARRGSGVRS